MLLFEKFFDKNGVLIQEGDELQYGDPEIHTARVFKVLRIDDENNAFWYNSNDELDVKKYSKQSAYQEKVEIIDPLLDTKHRKKQK